MAIGIGLLAGFGVRFTSKVDGAAPGVAAVLAACVVIVASKWLGVSLLVDDEMQAALAENVKPAWATDRGAAVAWTADGILEEEYPALGASLPWPPGYDYDTASRPEHYPPEIARKAAERWDGLSQEEKDARVAGWSMLYDMNIAAVRADGGAGFKQEAFLATFGFMDLVFFGIAAFTAFGAGSGAGDDD